MTITLTGLAAKYGTDATEWLRRWDAGETLWTVSMGGMGSAYEQCIQVTAAEILRYLITHPVDPIVWGDDDGPEATIIRELTTEAIDKVVRTNPNIVALGGISGAQAYAARELALKLHRFGPVDAFTHPSLDPERLIQWNKNLDLQEN